MSIQQHWIQKLNQFKKLQKTHILHYTILKTLNQAIQQQPKIPFNQTYQYLLKSFPKQIKQLTLTKQLIHSIWINDQYPIHVREQCCQQILKNVTQWIMEFQIKSDQIHQTSQKFKLIKQFIQKNCNHLQTTLLIIDQIYQDLKDLFDQSFWNLPQQNIQSYKQYTFVVQADAETPQQIINLLQLLLYRQIQTIQIKNQQVPQFYISTLNKFTSQNYYTFVHKCINYLLCLQLNQSYQSQANKLALYFSKTTYCLKNQQNTIKLFKRLMLRTKKSVRYALVQEYIQTYKYFQTMHCDRIIQQLQDIIYFRQLIVGHSKSQSNNMRVLQDNTASIYFTQIFIKAGSKQRIFFAIQDCEKAILKLELIFEEGMDINLKIYHLSSGSKQVLYHQQNKTQLRKLDLKIDYMGLYAIEFDNTYSWIHGKTILYNLHLMKKIDNINQLIGLNR